MRQTLITGVLSKKTCKLLILRSLRTISHVQCTKEKSRWKLEKMKLVEIFAEDVPGALDHSLHDSLGYHVIKYMLVRRAIITSRTDL